MGVGSELSRRSADGGGGLQRMPALHAPATARTLAGLDVELTLDGPTGNLGLILDDDLRGCQAVVAAVRTRRRQIHLVGLVDGVGQRGQPMGMRAVIVARLATGRLRIGLGPRFLAERRGLSLARAALGFKRGREAPDFPEQLRHLLLELSYLALQTPAARTSLLRLLPVHGLDSLPRIRWRWEEQLRTVTKYSFFGISYWNRIDLGVTGVGQYW